MSNEERAERDKQRKRERYANNPEYRAQKQAANRAYHSTTPYDPERNKAYHAARQAEDPEYRKRRGEASRRWNQQHIERLNAFIAEAKDKPCVDCGQQLAPFCMEFDHVRGVKLFPLSKAARRSRSLAEVEAEIAKCEVRCVVCHRTRHFGGKTATVLNDPES